MTKFTEEYQKKIQQEYDTKISESDFWREFLKVAYGTRISLTRQLETKPMDGIKGVLEVSKLQGNIEGIDRIIRSIGNVLDRKSIAGITGVFPGI